MQVWQPGTVDEAVAMVAEPGAVAVAGGTALNLVCSLGTPKPAALVALGRVVPAGIEDAGDGLRIGAGVTLDSLARSGVVAARVPLLARAVQDVAAEGVRRLATLGGQVGWGAGCLLPALLALDARVVGTGGMVGLADWLAAPKGVILWIEVPAQASGAWVWRKVGYRAAFSPAALVVAGAGGGARIAAGGGPVRPQRLPGVEAALAAGAPDTELQLAVEQGLIAPDCALRTGAWRRRVAGNAVVAGFRGLPPVRVPVARLPAGQPPVGLRVLTDDPGQADWHARPDIAGKLRGQAGFLTDARAPGMLVGRILRAGRPHARIVSLDTSRAEALAGVRAVVTHRDIAGQNAFGIMWADQPALCHDVVRHAGDPVAAVAAVDEVTADAALALIDVVYVDLQPVTDPAAALDPGAPALHARGNLAAETALSRGDADAALARAAHVVTGTYTTPRQMHAFLETEGGWCAPDGAGGLTVAVGGQHGARDREQLARILGLPEDRIRVITSPIGGGFGGKDELTVQPALALLALKAGAAVRLHLSRAESILAGVKRNPMVIRMTTGVDATGRLCGHRVDALADCGAYASLSPAVLETTMEHAAGPYVVADVTTRGRLAYTNNGLCGAFRGFGANQMTFAIEAQMDRLAAACGLDPAEIRRRNLRVPGTPGFLGQAVAGSERVAEMLEAAAASALWVAPEALGEEIVATGMALNHQGNGLGSIPKDEVEGRLRLAPDGAVEVACGLDEMGQGLVPALTAAVAAHLGCARGDVRVVYGDTARAPDSGSTSASRGAFVAWQMAARTAPGFTSQVLELAGRALGRPAESLRIVAGGVAPEGTNSVRPAVTFANLAANADVLPVELAAFAFPKTDYMRGNARFIHCNGATLARVAVNRVTGMVRVMGVEMHTAAGPVIDLAAYLGQIEGGLLQGLGLTLIEDILFEGGQQRNGTLHGYTLPMLADAPRYRVTALEGLDDGDPWGPRGVGELGIGAVTAAIANAVGAALGRWPEATPFQPETVLSLMEGT